VTLPPGQRAIDGFPRFGTHLHRPPPAVPDNPSIEIGGAVMNQVTATLDDLATLPRRRLDADFHCVAGWSATDLVWEGISFEALYRAKIAPALEAGTQVTHLVFEGLDGYRSVVTLEDALSEQTLIADRLDGQPLDSDHGAPLRFVSPSQYGFISAKHLCRIEVHTSEPRERYDRSPALARVLLRGSFAPHQRARVWKEERNRHLPGRAVRPVYRLLIAPIRSLCARGSQHSHSKR
jgi:DMSO/TMAO reductase YedYZ molybdopterin-dependent catalytic subunit